VHYVHASIDIYQCYKCGYLIFEITHMRIWLLKNFGIKEPLVPVVSRTSKNRLCVIFLKISNILRIKVLCQNQVFFHPHQVMEYILGLITDKYL